MAGTTKQTVYRTLGATWAARLVAVPGAVAALFLLALPAAAELPADAPTPPPAIPLVLQAGADADLPRDVQRVSLRPAHSDIARTTKANLTDRARPGDFQPNAHLRLCFPSLSNAPNTDDALFLERYYPLVLVRGRVLVATMPVNDACLSSGFGPRFGRVHKGIDLIAHKGDPIFAAAPGVVREAGWGRGYGKYVVLDHGHGVYTRYAHLNTIDKDVTPGQSIGFGQPLGTMGNTGNSTGVHLHYEVLTGEWGPMKAFGLDAHNPLDFPAYSPAPMDAVLTINARLTDDIAP